MTRAGFGDLWWEKSISHGKPYNAYLPILKDWQWRDTMQSHVHDVGAVSWPAVKGHLSCRAVSWVYGGVLWRQVLLCLGIMNVGSDVTRWRSYDGNEITHLACLCGHEQLWWTLVVFIRSIVCQWLTGLFISWLGHHKLSLCFTSRELPKAIRQHGIFTHTHKYNRIHTCANFQAING